MKHPKSQSISVRLEADLKERLVRASRKLDLSENDIARHAIRAAVNGIEANGYKIELPLEMVLKKAPPISRVERGALGAIKNAPIGGSRPTGLNEPEGEYPSKKGKRQ
jgi:predicted DNA-binding protein